MKFGWRPRIKIQDPPIPLFFNYSGFTEPTSNDCIEVYSGCRPRDSYDVHWLYANKGSGYIFKFPNLIQNAIYDYPQSLNEVIGALPDYQYDTSVWYEGMNEEIYDWQQKVLK